jgi:hypothetical protein
VTDARIGSHAAVNGFDNPRSGAESDAMSKLEAIETEVRHLPRADVLQLQDWLADYLEDQAELNPEFVASIERGKADLREGRARVRKG